MWQTQIRFLAMIALVLAAVSTGIVVISEKKKPNAYRDAMFLVLAAILLFLLSFF